MANFNFNKVILGGRLTADPELKTTPGGVSVTVFTVAVNRRSAKEAADFLNVIAWRQTAEFCNRYLAKGRKVAVIGELQARTYEAKDGTTRMSLDVAADEVEFLTPKSDDQGNSYSAPTAPRPQGNRKEDVAGFTDISSDDIPF